MGRRRAEKGITIGYTTDINQGKKREYQQDRLIVLQDKKWGILFAVADGMGGHTGGDIAAEIALETLEKNIEALVFPFPPPSEKDLLLALQTLFHEANTQVYLHAAEDLSLEGMGTTLVAGWIPPLDITRKPLLVVSWCGDSMLYLSRKVGKKRTLSEQVNPHNIFGSILLHAIGVKPKTTVEGHTLELKNKDKIILCSDGLSGYGVTQQVLNQNKTAPELVKYALALGGHDNIAVIVAEIKYV